MFEQLRHQPPQTLERPRELIVACSPMRSNVNLSRIVRMAGCCGVTRVVCCGHARVIGKIARDSVSPRLDGPGASQTAKASKGSFDGDDEAPVEGVRIDTHRTLAPVLEQLRREGYRLVGLEQATNSHNLHAYHFARRTALVIGNERHGIADEVLRLLDDVVEIPVYGHPLAYNAATAATIALYEYCRQFPQG